MTMDSRKSVQSLAETIQSLLGLKSHLTSAWVKSVRDIIKKLPLEPSSADSKLTNFETNGYFDNKDLDPSTTISKIKDQLAVLNEHINQLNKQRREVLRNYLDLKGNIRVFCRIRPINMGENFGCLRPVVALDSSSVVLKLADFKSKSYTFDKVFHPGSTQDEVFSEVEPIVKSVLDGYNACIFAYGQTGTGKTYTMEGSLESPGIVPRAIEALFHQAEDCNHPILINFSMLEIYLGNLRDLLATQPTKAIDPMPPCLSIHTDTKGEVEIDDLVAIQVSDFNQVLKLYRLGCRFRSTASTNSNMNSSRSHCMIRISITCFGAPERRRETNKIWLVDLGGSERVMKTKASGRRLDEGKAINLSLSALGDVISALQRKRHHIPYRNSKLTQVLKDSLGEDSKTLMLVHVSPKEEDLCETICSLNFATRVKSVHIGYGDFNEARDQKEDEMMNLKQRMKEIEEKRSHVRKDIEKLNEKLETLTGTSLSFQGQIGPSEVCIGEPLSNLETPSNWMDDVKTASSSQLPRFMRPTICSRRKSGTNLQIAEGRYNPTRRRRRLSSHRAESITFPVKDNSEYNSERSISRSSCLADLNMKKSADNETEYSQDGSECDIKAVVFSQHDKPRGSLSRKGAQPSYYQKYGSGKTSNFNSTKFSRVDNWLHLHNGEPTVLDCTHRSKRDISIPTQEKLHRFSEENKVENLQNEVPQNELIMRKVMNGDKMERPVSVHSVANSMSNILNNKPPKMLKDLFKEDQEYNIIPSSRVTDNQIILQTHENGSSLIEDHEQDTFSHSDVCCGRCKDDHGSNLVSIMQASKQCSEILGKNCRCMFSPSDSDGRNIDSEVERGDSVLAFEQESYCQEIPTQTGTIDSINLNLDGSSQHSPNKKRLGILKLKSQRALFLDNANQRDVIASITKSPENTLNKGTCYILHQKIQILRCSALLGLGFHDLGYENDFFYGLML